MTMNLLTLVIIHDAHMILGKVEGEKAKGDDFSIVKSVCTGVIINLNLEFHYPC